MEDFFAPFEEPIDPRPVRQGKWPHKCAECGRFVKHEGMRHGMQGEDYYANAPCDNCKKRTEAHPI